MKIYTLHKRSMYLHVILLLLLMGAGNVDASTVAFPPSYTVSRTTLELRGKSVLHYLMVIKAYAGAFYLEKGATGRKALADVAKRLELEYFHAIEAEDFARATRTMIAKNISKKHYMRLRKRVEEFNALYRNVKPGDRYAITYLPGKGTTLTLNGRPLGTIAGYDFSYALFSVWIGKNPIDKKMKKELLGRIDGRL
jgi:hypothetical protein